MSNFYNRFSISHNYFAGRTIFRLLKRLRANKLFQSVVQIPRRAFAKAILVPPKNWKKRIIVLFNIQVGTRNWNVVGSRFKYRNWSENYFSSHFSLINFYEIVVNCPKLKHFSSNPLSLSHPSHFHTEGRDQIHISSCHNKENLWRIMSCRTYLHLFRSRVWISKKCAVFLNVYLVDIAFLRTLKFDIFYKL